ncbi:uncharacterized protein LOC120147763 [Hibiscus syriacus]|uniref:uncharacterized protein LOC120147763 n=1 Tax=Hibiscus syriacus TaxID=106335 RepID=UPI001922648E|nr:uncharacterized protein LOC120147763 [Hibiscus syriacus]
MFDKLLEGSGWFVVVLSALESVLSTLLFVWATSDWLNRQVGSIVIVSECFAYTGKVAEFGQRRNGVWYWKIEFRRTFFDWESKIWENFLELINRVVSVSVEVDQLVWKGSSSSVYTPKRFCNSVVSVGVVEDSVWILVWAKLAPPKVEAFVWKAVLRRVPSLVELTKRGIQNLGRCLCSLCHEQLESSDHLFCQCKVSWEVWQRWCSNWRVVFVCPDNVKSFIIAWENQPVKKTLKSIWKMAFFGIIWSIWLYRNELFNDKPCS